MLYGIRNGNKTYDEDRTLENCLDTYIVTCYQECLIGDYLVGGICKLAL